MDVQRYTEGEWRALACGLLREATRKGNWEGVVAVTALLEARAAVPYFYAALTYHEGGADVISLHTSLEAATEACLRDFLRRNTPKERKRITLEGVSTEELIEGVKDGHRMLQVFFKYYGRPKENFWTAHDAYCVACARRGFAGVISYDLDEVRL
jgi:hypothetical protein